MPSISRKVINNAGTGELFEIILSNGSRKEDVVIRRTEDDGWNLWKMDRGPDPLGIYVSSEAAEEEGRILLGGAE